MESETYIGGHVECLEAGVFRDDIPNKFEMNRDAFQELIDNIDNNLQIGGLFMGTCFDGSTVWDRLKDMPKGEFISQKNEKGLIDVRLDNVIVYRYDDSGDDYNYVDVDIIIDNDDMLSFNGEVRNVNENETRIYLSSPKDGPRFLDLFDDMKKGKNIYVRTTGAKDPIVFKYSLSGFSAGYTKLINGWSDWVDNNKNPFDSKNPFRN